MSKFDRFKDKDKNKDAKVGAGLQFDIMPKALDSFPTNAMPTTQEMGARLRVDGLASELDNPFQRLNSTPGWMKLTFLPVLGSNAHMRRASTLRLVPQNIWSSLRNYCTTAVNYQPGDIENVLLQLAQVPMMMAKVRRQLRSLKMASDLKNYYPYDFWKAVIPVTGTVTRASEVSMIDNNISLYNSIVQQYNKIAPPDMFPLFHRWEYMLEQVFTDIEPKDGEVAQWIFFDTDTYYKTHLADPAIPGAQMDPHSMMVDIHGLLTIINDLVNDIYDDASVRLILGDLYQTYSDMDKYKIAELKWEDIADGIKPIHDFKMLFSLYHATVVPVTPPTLNVNVLSGELEGKYFVGLPGDAFYLKENYRMWIKLPKLFNANEWGTTPSDMVVFTQWMLSEPEYDDIDGIRAPGTEIITAMEISYYAYRHNSEEVELVNVPCDQFTCIAAHDSTGDYTKQHYFTACLLRSFAYAPIQYYIWGSTYGDVWQNVEVQGTSAELELPVYPDYQNLISWKDCARIEYFAESKYYREEDTFD